MRLALTLAVVAALGGNGVTMPLKQWEFKPGTRQGKAVPVRIAVELTFTLR